jgi:hypothetical protein
MKDFPHNLILCDDCTCNNGCYEFLICISSQEDAPILRKATWPSSIFTISEFLLSDNKYTRVELRVSV